MTKYVCDFDAINDTVSQLNNLSTELEGIISKQSANLSSTLISWSGEASDTFKNSSSSISEGLNKDAENIKAMATYLQESAKTIEDAENELASLKI